MRNSSDRYVVQVNWVSDENEIIGDFLTRTDAEKFARQFRSHMKAACLPYRDRVFVRRLIPARVALRWEL